MGENGQLKSPQIIQPLNAERFPVTKIFEVQSKATGDGVYNCYEQILDATQWDDTSGADRFTIKSSISVEVFNLLENDTTANYWPALAKYDLILARQQIDDEGNKRWVGIPLVNGPRRAITTQAAPDDTVIIANLFDRHGVEITSGLGFEIYVYCDILGGGMLNEAEPHFTNDAPLSVYNQQGTWMCSGLFQHRETCAT